MKQFDFGKNWQDFSSFSLDLEKAKAAEGDLLDFFGDALYGASFLDIGFGQGLALLAAKKNGAKVVGNDINIKCHQALEMSARFFPEVNLSDIPISIGSILDAHELEKLKCWSPNSEGFDLVHSWGVLHHTGDMEAAIKNAASLVRPGGRLAIAIYNKHWSCPVWKWVKKGYVLSSPLIQNGIVCFFTPIIFLAKLLVTRKNPFKKKRGMDFTHDIIDWVGGYPYEYASTQEINNLVSSLGFMLEKEIPAQVPTGCNEFLFRRH